MREGERKRERERERYLFVGEVGSWLSLRNLRLFGGEVGEPASVEAIKDSQRNTEGLSDRLCSFVSFLNLASTVYQMT